MNYALRIFDIFSLENYIEFCWVWNKFWIKHRKADLELLFFMASLTFFFQTEYRKGNENSLNFKILIQKPHNVVAFFPKIHFILEGISEKRKS